MAGTELERPWAVLCNLYDGFLCYCGRVLKSPLSGSMRLSFGWEVDIVSCMSRRSSQQFVLFIYLFIFAARTKSYSKNLRYNRLSLYRIRSTQLFMYN